jgi:hypothetical protein
MRKRRRNELTRPRCFPKPAAYRSVATLFKKLGPDGGSTALLPCMEEASTPEGGKKQNKRQAHGK